MKTGDSRRSRVNYTGSRWFMPRCTVIALLLVRGHCASLVAVAAGIAGIASWWLHSSKVLQFLPLFGLELEHKQNARGDSGEWAETGRTNGVITVPPTHTHLVRIRRSKRRLNIVYDMRYATPKRNNTNSNEHPGLHWGTESAIASVQFVRSTIAVAAARTCFIFGSSVRGGSAQNSVTGWKLHNNS